MNADQLNGQWKQVEGEGKSLWGKLNDDDWKIATGDLEKLAGRIQERYGDAKEVVLEQIAKLLHRIGESADKAAGHPEAALQVPAAGPAVGPAVGTSP